MVNMLCDSSHIYFDNKFTTTTIIIVATFSYRNTLCIIIVATFSYRNTLCIIIVATFSYRNTLCIIIVATFSYRNTLCIIIVATFSYRNTLCIIIVATFSYRNTLCIIIVATFSYPMAIGNLGELEEIRPTASRPKPMVLFHKAVEASSRFYNNHHVYPHTSLGNFCNRHHFYKEAIRSWCNAADVIRKSVSNISLCILLLLLILYSVKSSVKTLL